MLTGDRRVATIATILVCVGGGMGWIRLVGDLVAGGRSRTVDAPHQQPLRQHVGRRLALLPDRLGASGPGFLPHRATTLGLPGLVAVVLLVVTCLGRRPAGVLLAGLLAALLAPFHFYAFPATYLIVAAVRPDDRRVAAPKRVGAMVPSSSGRSCSPCRSSADAVVRQRDIGAFQLVLGWSEARFEHGPLGVLFFYATNLGLPVRAGDRRRRRPRAACPSRRFLVAWMVALFLSPTWSGSAPSTST